MKRFRVLCIVQLLLFLAVGCARDPQARRAKFTENGNRYFEKGKYAEAAIEYRSAVQADPNSADAHYRLAITATKLGDWTNAVKQLERTVELQPDNTQAQLDLGNILFAGRDWERAEQIAFAVLQKDQSNATAHSLMANVAEARGHHADALTEIEKAISIDPKNAGLYLTRGAFEGNAGALQAAEKTYKKALELDPKYTAAMTALAQIYERQQRWDDAEKLFKDYVAADPSSASARLELAKVYFAANHRYMAEQVLIQAQKDLANDPAAYRMLPEFYQTIGQNEKALQQFEILHNQHPKDLQTATEYARLLLGLNNLDKADQVNEQVLKESARDVNALSIKAEILTRRGNSQAAVTLLRGALADEPNNAIAHYTMGMALNESGDRNGAVNEWKRAAELQPDFVQVQRVLARVALDAKDVDSLRAASEKIIAYDAGSPEGYVFRALAEANDKSSSSQAEADLNTAMQVAPQNPLGFAKMAEFRASQKRYADAEKLYEEALQRDPNYSDALRGLVAIYTEQKQPAKAWSRVQAQIAKAPQSSDYYMVFAGLQVNKNDLAGAEASLKKAIALNSNNMDAFLLLGQVEVKEGSMDQAIANSYEWINKNPKDVRAYLLTGSLEDSRGNWKAAQDLYRKALGIQPNYALAANNLAYSMLDNGGDLDVALSLAQTAHGALPNVATIKDTLAWAYYKKGLYKMSIDLLEEALKAEPNSSLYHYHVGLAYAKMSDLARAKSHLRRSLDLEPNSPQAVLARTQLEQLGS